jgi:predicted nucleotidyltransferase
VVNTLHEVGFGLVGLTVEDFIKKGQIIQLGHEPVRIDIINDIPAVDFEQAYPRLVTADIDQVKINFIGLQDLKLNKLAAGRNKDMDDVNAIQKLEKALDKKKRK